MRRFKFRLATLESLKGMELDQLKQQLAAAHAELRKAEQAWLSTRDALNEAYNELAAVRTKRTDSVILLSLESYTVLLRQQLTARATAVAQQKKALAEAQARLSAKHKEKKVLEKYRERQLAKYSQYVERETQKDLDEAAKNAHEQKAEFDVS